MFRWIWPGAGLLLVAVGAIVYWGFDGEAVGLVLMIAGASWATIAMIPAGIRSAFRDSRAYRDRGLSDVEDERH